MVGLVVFFDMVDKGVIDDYFIVCFFVLKNVVCFEVCVCEEFGFYGFEVGIRCG